MAKSVSAVPSVPDDPSSRVTTKARAALRVAGSGDGGDGGEPTFDELVFIAEKMMASHIADIDWDSLALRDAALRFVTDPEDAKVITRLMKQAHIEVSIGASTSGR